MMMLCAAKAELFVLDAGSGGRKLRSTVYGPGSSVMFYIPPPT